MFLGYQNELIRGSDIETLFVAFAAETREELESLSYVSLVKIEETNEPVELIGGRYCVGKAAINEAKSEQVRQIRNQYLEIYIDPVVSNPLRWGEMTLDEQQQYVNYRKYLLNITEKAEFPNVEVFNFDEWKQSLDEIGQTREEITNG